MTLAAINFIFEFSHYYHTSLRKISEMHIGPYTVNG